jgi:hypothetical protein
LSLVVGSVHPEPIQERSRVLGDVFDAAHRKALPRNGLGSILRDHLCIHRDSLSLWERAGDEMGLSSRMRRARRAVAASKPERALQVRADTASSLTPLTCCHPRWPSPYLSQRERGKTEGLPATWVPNHCFLRGIEGPAWRRASIPQPERVGDLHPSPFAWRRLGPPILASSSARFGSPAIIAPLLREERRWTSCCWSKRRSWASSRG